MAEVGVDRVIQDGRIGGDAALHVASSNGVSGLLYTELEMSVCTGIDENIMLPPLRLVIW